MEELARVLAAECLDRMAVAVSSVLSVLRLDNEAEEPALDLLEPVLFFSLVSSDDDSPPRLDSISLLNSSSVVVSDITAELMRWIEQSDCFSG